MFEYLFSYLASWWGIVVLLVTFVVFGLKAYDIFAKAWPASTGNYVTEGKITWSEFITPEVVLAKKALFNAPNEGLISYSYRVNGIQHNGTIPTHTLTQTEVDTYLYKGADIQVFYAPKRPSYSRGRKPPSPWMIGSDIFSLWLILPLLAINAISFFIWFLANA